MATLIEVAASQLRNASEIANWKTNANLVKQFAGLAVRNLEGTSLQDGDIIDINVDKIKAMKVNLSGAEMVTFVVNVYRNGAWTTAQLFPTSMYKARVKAENIVEDKDAGTVTFDRGARIASDGTAVKDCQKEKNFVDFLVHNNGKKMLVSDPNGGAIPTIRRVYVNDQVDHEEIQYTHILNFDWTDQELPAVE